MKKLTSLIVAALFTALTFTSCEVEKSANNLVGTWELKSTTIYYYENGETKTTEPQDGEWEKYTFTESFVTITSNKLPSSSPMPYTIKDDKIVGIGLNLEIEKLTNSTLKLKFDNPIKIEGGIDYTISTYKKM